MNLKALRERSGLTQEQLASKLQISRTYVSRLESGDREIDLSLAERWSSACGSRLILVPEEEATTMARFMALTPPLQEVVADLIQVAPRLVTPRIQDLKVLLNAWKCQESVN